jgi:class 3 adenylate cyclase/tetratricopeptide (TPR) repeat protein
MRCPTCGHENPPGALFCNECAASLSPVCAGCGARNPPDAKFCSQCAKPLAATAIRAKVPERAPRDYTPRHLAEKILQSKSALEGERKQVTVLFADVKGSMELAEKLDPEEWHAILERFFQILSDGVHRFEGTVNQYTGDGIMALFGAPIAHEDHAQRACYAALWLRDALREHADQLRVTRGLSFSVRMGLNSGEVVVGKIGDDLRMDYTAQGHTVGLAARMQQLAEPGKALLAGRTIERAEGYFALRDLGETIVTGVEAPVRVAELEGVGRMRTRFDRSRARGLSRFVGRDEELERLEAALNRSLAGDGQVVGVVAEAGAGKSRLCHELAELCRARGILVRSGAGVPHGRSLPLEPVLQLNREIYGIAPEDTDALARQKIAGFVAQLAPEELGSLPLLFEFMRVPDPARPAAEQTADERLRAILELVRRLNAARSRREPALYVFEDLHWIDPQTEEIIEGFVDATAGTRTLLVVNFRPEYRAAWMGRTHYQQLPLRPLDAAAATALLADWLGPDPSLAGLAERIRERTGGNPFFMEEVIQAEIDAGQLVGTRGRFRLARPVGSIEVPASVQSLLAARIDRLDEATKRLLQTASVIGDGFAEPLVARVAGSGPEAVRGPLRALVQSEFLYEQSLYPELEYAFKHPLTREVAYGSLLRERRRELHGRTAEAIEASAGDTADAHAAVIAHHFEEADRLLDASRWHVRAADRLGSAGVRETLFHWRKVTELLAGEVAAPEARVLLGRARSGLLYAASRSDLPEEDVVALFETALRATPEEESIPRAQLFMVYALVRGTAGHRDEAVRLVEEALATARRLADHDLLADALAIGTVVMHFDEAPERVLELFREIEATAQGDASIGGGIGLRPLVIGGLQGQRALLQLGRAAEAEALLLRLRELASGSGSPFEASALHISASSRLAQQGDLDGALEEARRSFEQSQHTSNPVMRAMAHSALASVSARAGRHAEAERELEHAIRIGLDGRVSAVSGVHSLASLARWRLARGDAPGAREAVERGLEFALAHGLGGAEAACRVARAHVLLAEDGAKAIAPASEEIDRAEALARERGLQVTLALVEEARAEVAALSGDRAAREHALREAARLHRACGDTWAAEQAEGRIPAAGGPS